MHLKPHVQVKPHVATMFNCRLCRPGHDVTRCMVCRLLHNSSVKVFQHPLKKLQFLTGRKGRSELALIGGAWDPVDGPDPAHSPSTLIATATRAFKAATGVDLSAAVHW